MESNETDFDVLDNLCKNGINYYLRQIEGENDIMIEFTKNSICLLFKKMFKKNYNSHGKRNKKYLGIRGFKIDNKDSHYLHTVSKRGKYLRHNQKLMKDIDKIKEEEKAELLEEFYPKRRIVYNFRRSLFDDSSSERRDRNGKHFVFDKLPKILSLGFKASVLYIGGKHKSPLHYIKQRFRLSYYKNFNEMNRSC